MWEWGRKIDLIYGKALTGVPSIVEESLHRKSSSYQLLFRYCLDMSSKNPGFLVDNPHPWTNPFSESVERVLVRGSYWNKNNPDVRKLRWEKILQLMWWGTPLRDLRHVPWRRLVITGGRKRKLTRVLWNFLFSVRNFLSSEVPTLLPHGTLQDKQQRWSSLGGRVRLVGAAQHQGRGTYSQKGDFFVLWYCVCVKFSESLNANLLVSQDQVERIHFVTQYAASLIP